MSALRWIGVAAVVAAASWLSASWADDEHGRNVDPSRQVIVPVKALAVRKDVRVTEGPRMLGDEFPYLAVAPVAVSSTRATELVPSTLSMLLPAAGGREGTTPVHIDCAEAAIDAVRLFVAGPLVTEAETAERMIATGRELSAKLEHLDVKVTDHRPDTWAPTAKATGPGDAEGAPASWTVSLVAYEMDRMLRLVHVTATVGADGTVAIQRQPIVDGPMTSWQTGVMGEWTDEMEARQKAMREEVIVARRTYARALHPAKTLDAFWTAGRLALGMDDVRDLFGEPDRDIGSGVHLWTYDLADGTSVIFSGAAQKVVQVLHVRNAKGPLASFDTLGAIYVRPTR